MQRRDFLQTSTQAALAVGILSTVTTACLPVPGSGDAALAEIRQRYFLGTLRWYPVTSTYLGGDGYDSSLADVNGTLRDWSSAGVAAELAEYHTILGDLDGIAANSLSAPAAIDLEVMRAQVAYVTRQLDTRRYQERAIDSYVAEPFRGVDWQIQQMTDAGSGRLGTAQEWDLVAKRVEAIPAYIATAKANLEAGRQAGNLPDRRMVARDGPKGCEANAEYFTTTLSATATPLLGDRRFARAMLDRLKAAGARAASEWRTFGTWMTTAYDANETTDRFAAGEAEYAWRVNNCLRDGRTPEQLFAYGAEQVTKYEDKIFTVARQVADGAHLRLDWSDDASKRTSVRAVMDHLSKDSPKDDAELFAWYRGAGERAVAYGRERGLFDVPADYRLDVVETPPVLRSTIDAAYYPAPPFKRAGVGRFYLSPTGNDPGALKLNNRASVATTAVHEGFPGHDWHYKYMTQHAAEISPIRWLTPGAVEDSFSMWEDSMAAEGWALYSEELMAEPADGRPFGFYEPGEYLYMLQGQLMRSVRVRVDTGIHTGRMTFDEAVDYFSAHVEFYPGARAKAARDPVAKAVFDTAARAIYRYSKWPTQAITYNLGKVTIQQLRAEVERKEGSSFNAKAFHERFMRMGTIPVGYFRESFLAG
ncbi:MAG: DUF885 domain-containing protein [Gemmatimonadota bacterium]